MGQGGYITLVNSTNSDWKNTHQHAYQMNSWKFPATIQRKTSVRVYVEWNEEIFKHHQDDSGEVVYQLEGTSQTFQVQARAKNGFELKIFFDNLTTFNQSKGSTFSLGWQHDGNVQFVLAGHEGHYTSTGSQAENWMHDNLPLIGNKKLKQICITGSHDAGMSTRHSGTPFGQECNTLTQSRNIKNQLLLGTRYFDIRPVIGEGDYYTGHYGQIADTTWQGANGQSIDLIINDINSFTSNHKELIVLNLSHSLNTQVGNLSYRALNQEEWDKLFMRLKKLNHLYTVPDNENIDLADLTLNDFIQNNPAVLLIIEQSSVNLGDKQGKGFFKYKNFNVYNKYSNSNDVNKMISDQLDKMKKQNGKSYFLLSWTLTQDAVQASTCFLPMGGSSIIDLAKQANQELAYKLDPVISSSNFPNIIYTDNITDNNPAAMAMAVNTKLHL